MAESDPITDSTPRKRLKTSNGGSKAWDSQDDSGDEFTVEDYETARTVPQQGSQTQSQKRKQISYPAHAFRADMASMTGNSSSYITQPTQPLPTWPLPTQTQTLQQQYVTQPTQPLPPRSPPTVLVNRSSPALASSPKVAPAPAPAPFQRARSSYLQTAINGTEFRRPSGVQSRPAVISVDSDDDDQPPPVNQSSDIDETQGLTSNLKPTQFKRGGRGLNSTPNRDFSDRTIRESPRSDALPSGGGGTFSNLMNGFRHDESRPPPARTSSDLMATAYGGVSRGARMPHPGRPRPVVSAVRYQTLDDVDDFRTRTTIEEMQMIMSESVQRCYDALVKKKGNKQDAIAWLAETEADVVDDVDPLSSMTPVAKRGVAMTKSSMSSQQMRPAAKQQVKVPSKSIAERYAPTQAQRKPSMPGPLEDSDEEIPRPKRQLLKGRRPRSPSPPSSPPAKAGQPKQRLKQRKVVSLISDDEEEEAVEEDDDSDSGIGREESVEAQRAPAEIAFDVRLLKYFNESSVQEIADLSALPEEVVAFVLEQRPFVSLDIIRTISNAKPGSKSRALPIGDRLVDKCAEMLLGYEAVDELVEECAKLAKPIQKALKGWGARETEGGELELMNLDDAHDSGIGTPASSCAGSDSQAAKKGGNFLKQPASMAEDMHLKDYQLVGLNWLNLLWDKKLSCILADDMGLGKTCQVIAFLAHLQEQRVDGVHLVIVPGSTIANWLREFQRFAPQLSVFPYYGSDKERPELRYRIEEQFNEIDVVVTTYDMATKPDDNYFLRKKIEPAVCVYDEAHLLRNPKTDRYQKLLGIPADFRLLLTGTPLQNNLRELVAILAFIMPEIFREKRDQLDFIFDQKATTKDANHAALLSAERIARARTMMTPFILRRKKAQVLDLPAKHSRVEMCEMLNSQAQHYADIVDEARAALLGPAKAAAGKRSSNIMMALRKAAIHPLLSRRLYTDKKIDKMVSVLYSHAESEFAGQAEEKIRAYITGEAKTGQKLEGGDFGLHKFCEERNYMRQFALKKKRWMDSGKVQKFKELVTAYAANGDRLLVFSQFTTLMDILEAVLETMGVSFVRLDGSTKMETRQDLIDNFTNDTSITVFMLSTKAGGAGINLAAANKVIVFDSGFNPQDDVQAENRAHRVGQTREVEVVRLVSKGTIEEQIHALGESKLALDERVAGEDESQAEKSGQEVVRKMFLDSLKQGGSKDGGKEVSNNEGSTGDVRDAFKMGLEKSGVKVASKQAQF
ncbi:DNA-dependent ATPase fun30 [Elasticomyces elasticus]|nr:DNA-dependent ATPase fun30 [Elasticomyces elasticus]